MPVGAFGGRADIMREIAPQGPVYQAGTLSGNPVAMAAGLTTLELISEPGFFERLTAATRRLTEGLREQAEAAAIPMTTNQVGGMFGFFFTGDGKVENVQQATACNQEQFRKFYHGMLAEGVYLAPSAFEAGFVSSAHGAPEIEATIAAAGRVLRTL